MIKQRNAHAPASVQQVGLGERNVKVRGAGAAGDADIQGFSPAQEIVVRVVYPKKTSRNSADSPGESDGSLAFFFDLYIYIHQAGFVVRLYLIVLFFDFFEKAQLV